MLAARAVSASLEDPLSALEVGEVEAEPDPALRMLSPLAVTVHKGAAPSAAGSSPFSAMLQG